MDNVTDENWCDCAASSPPIYSTAVAMFECDGKTYEVDIYVANSCHLLWDAKHGTGHPLLSPGKMVKWKPL